MKFEFSESQKKDGLNILEFEDVVFEADYVLKTAQDEYLMCGCAKIDGEVYNEFEIIFSVSGDFNDINELLNADWDWYDYNL